ncbi:hypothetical protein PpBr36_02422 [Pyricularia pennisetigena]|uniref:hypothetical protein n=1 Tax=Pyricularia pennisetigena TaxID=1578925 RepID=UPI001154F2F7|nr:hypothetical protein PpBr36_02422 [Pyricularia pennisetigena]TLS30330.1 hypothetical protein PpBr36_02422 [Pyricularia pennisetigena]
MDGTWGWRPCPADNPHRVHQRWRLPISILVRNGVQNNGFRSRWIRVPDSAFVRLHRLDTGISSQRLLVCPLRIPLGLGYLGISNTRRASEQVSPRTRLHQFDLPPQHPSVMLRPGDSRPAVSFFLMLRVIQSSSLAHVGVLCGRACILASPMVGSWACHASIVPARCCIAPASARFQFASRPLRILTRSSILPMLCFNFSSFAVEGAEAVLDDSPAGRPWLMILLGLPLGIWSRLHICTESAVSSRLIVWFADCRADCTKYRPHEFLAAVRRPRPGTPL